MTSRPWLDIVYSLTSTTLQSRNTPSAGQMQTSGNHPVGPNHRGGFA